MIAEKIAKTTLSWFCQPGHSWFLQDGFIGVLITSLSGPFGGIAGQPGRSAAQPANLAGLGDQLDQLNNQFVCFRAGSGKIIFSFSEMKSINDKLTLMKI